MLSFTTVFSADVTLTWYRPNDSRVTGYEIFYGPKDADFKSSPKEIIPSPEHANCNIIGLITGETYAFAAKSVDKFGNKSVFSEVIFYTAPNEQNNNQDDNNSDKIDNTDDNKKYDGNQSNSNNKTSGSGGGGCFIQLTLNPADQTMSEIKMLDVNQF